MRDLVTVALMLVAGGVRRRDAAAPAPQQSTKTASQG